MTTAVIEGTATDVTPLNAAERKALAKSEAVIERGLRNFVEVGTELARIRDGRLYRADYGTFEAYVQQRWDLARPTAYRYITAAEMSTKVDTPLPSLEHARLISLLPEDRLAELAPRVAAMNRADATAFVRDFDKVPAKSVKAVQALFSEDPPTPAEKAFHDFVVAVDALDLSQLAQEDLAEFAGIVQHLADMYKAERTRRA